jgi:hypothetical protein
MTLMLSLLVLVEVVYVLLLVWLRLDLKLPVSPNYFPLALTLLLLKVVSMLLWVT